jgi:hypothetical protein
MNEIDMDTLFTLHEIEYGFNPEVNGNLYARLLGSDCE